MIYRFLHAFNARYVLIILGVYIIAFLLSMAMLFVFPLFPLAMVFLGVAGLGVAAVAGRGLSAVERWLARHALSAGTCPKCRQGGQDRLDPSLVWHCTSCGAAFEPSGAELEPAQA